jgi:hypothetical protein
MLNKKNNVLLEIQVIIGCESCQETGITIRQPGPLVFNEEEIFKCSNKGDDSKIENIKKILDQMTIDVPGFTDRINHLQCHCCNGTGKIKKYINLSELKQLLQE